jgi:hypothetical protein
MNGGHDDPNDRVYACERQCFGKSTPATCATYFGFKSCSISDAANPLSLAPYDEPESEK